LAEWEVMLALLLLFKANDIFSQED
jgi:hypothetical protein